MWRDLVFLRGSYSCRTNERSNSWPGVIFQESSKCSLAKHYTTDLAKKCYCIYLFFHR